MRILAIDTALEVCASGLYDIDRQLVLAAETMPMARGHAEALVPQISRVLDASGGARTDYDRIAVTVGPGSFTGLRVGVSAARALALAAGCPVVGVSTLAALAAPLMSTDAQHPVAACIDARHGRLYVQIFEADGGTLYGPGILPLADVVDWASRIGARLVGPGAITVATAWPKGQPRPLHVDPRAAPDLMWVALIGAVADPTEAPPRPLYLAPVDARPQDSHRLPRAG
jgi:tRNA threonylcarbamoyladenosine biosynthesis protein TsaB